MQRKFRLYLIDIKAIKEPLKWNCTYLKYSFSYSSHNVLKILNSKVNIFIKYKILHVNLVFFKKFLYDKCYL